MTAQFEKAIADYSRAIGLDPRSVASYKGRTFARQTTGDAKGALADYTKAIALDPKNPEPRQLRGVLYLNNNVFLEAIEDFTRVLELEPKYVAAYYSRGEAWRKRGLADPQAMFQAWALFPSHPEYWQDNALADYDKAIGLKADYAAGCRLSARG